MAIVRFLSVYLRYSQVFENGAGLKETNLSDQTPLKN